MRAHARREVGGARTVRARSAATLYIAPPTACGCAIACMPLELNDTDFYG
jgi:hypothetical protein